MGWFVFFVLVFVGSTAAAIALTNASKEAERNPKDPFDGVKLTPWSVLSGRAMKQAQENMDAEVNRDLMAATAKAFSLFSAIAAIIQGVKLFG